MSDPTHLRQVSGGIITTDIDRISIGNSQVFDEEVSQQMSATESELNSRVAALLKIPKKQKVTETKTKKKSLFD